ncbi:hypothetical protein DFH07DRAFT_892912 [Mycena maculata]|uniref:DUF7779 domain-containing protein n=1 Tax=Mycena maculata TaxID=230809 RepID=A0AAD7IAE1_9AGAR|nr:hypothetical protein DFH07DRAFT_892912 [Mycena maculata]
MSATSTPAAAGSRSPPTQSASKASSFSSSDWIGPSLVAARALAAAGECLPVPYVQGVFDLVIVVFETVEKVKKNREDLKELCGDILGTVEIVRDQITAYGDTAPERCKALCEDLDSCLKDMRTAVENLQGLRRFKEVFKSTSTADKISSHRSKLRTLREKFLLVTTADTNVQVHRLIASTSATPETLRPQPTQSINNCPPPSRIFYGRRTILDKMEEYFSQDLGTQHIFLLYGLGGAGKTQIALKFIEVSSHFSDIFLIDTSTTATIETGLQNIAGSTAQDALKWLSRKQDKWLLFFDNADDPTINLSSFFPRCNHGNIIITSRNRGLKVYAGSHVLVSDMEEADAVKLLLTSAAQDVTESKEKIAVEIVQELSCLPLAIIQAGSFISESGALNSYLTLFRQNQARLLSKKPAQSHDDYAGTVYTTWQISFDRLTGAAQTLLQLCSFLHHQGIFEQIFSLASAYTFPSYGPSKDELQRPMEFLSPFLGSDGDWDSLRFIEVTNELQAYSLINFDPETGLFSIHPLVHGWSRSTLTSEKEYHDSMVAIVGMTIRRMSSLALEPASPWLMPHIDSLRGSEIYVNPDFNDAFASIYRYSKRPAEATKINNVILQKRREILGDDHPDTLISMWNLATSYNHIHQPKKAEELLLVLLEKRKRTLGDNHLHTVQVMAEMSIVCNQLGQLQRAKELQVVVLKKYKEILGEDHPDTLRAMGNLAWLYLNLGQFHSSAELQAVVLEKRKRILGEDYPATLYTMAGLALAYRSLGQLDKAVELQTVVLEKRRIVHGEDHPEIPIAMRNLAVTYYQLGQFNKAEVLMVDVLKKEKESLGGDHPQIQETIQFLANIHQALHKSDQVESESALVNEIVSSDS